MVDWDLGAVWHNYKPWFGSRHSETNQSWPVKVDYVSMFWDILLGGSQTVVAQPWFCSCTRRPP